MQFTAGAVGGTLLTPIPWKLADDSAIWSQNWSWRPSPERGEITQAPTICLFCEGGCGIQARLVNNRRAILLEGNPNHPVNAGGICPLGAAGLQFLYAPYRIPQPLKQAGTRGDLSGFQPITWDEAMDELTGRLARLREQSGPHGLAGVTTHRASSMDSLWSHFFQAYGSPNLFKMPSPVDHQAAAAFLTTGHFSPVAFDLQDASLVLSFDTELLDGWGAPGRIQRLFGSWNRQNASQGRTTLVHLGSRCSMTAAKANRWIPVHPGTEPLVALSLAHVMVRERLHDAAYVNTHVFGFEDWRDAEGTLQQGFRSFILSGEFSPQRVASKAGLQPGEIIELAKTFAASPRSVAVWGKGQEGLPSPAPHDLSYLVLNILRGNLTASGTLSLVPPVPLGPLPSPELDAVAQEGLGRARQGNARLPGGHPGSAATFFRELNDPAFPVPEILLVHEANPLYTLPQTVQVRQALDRIGWIVSFSPFMDETAQMADLILPNHAPLERLDDIIGLPGTPYGYYAVANPILTPQQYTRHTGDVLFQLAQVLGGTPARSHPWKSYEAYLQDRVAGLAASGSGIVAESEESNPDALKAGDELSPNFKDAGDLWGKLLKGHCWISPPWDVLSRLNTPTGRIELLTEAFQVPGGQPEAGRIEIPSVHGTSTEESAEFPLYLIPYSTLQVSSGFYPNPPFMTKTVFDHIIKAGDQFVEINPRTARQLHLHEGDRALLKTPAGQAHVRVHLHEGAQPGVLYILRGFGHTAYDEYINSRGVNPNSLIKTQTDRRTGMEVVGLTPAQIEKA